MSLFHNTVEISACFTFTSGRRLSDFELRALHQALQSALGQQDGPAEQLLDALREKLYEMDCDPDNFSALGPLVKDGHPVNDTLTSEEA